MKVTECKNARCFFLRRAYDKSGRYHTGSFICAAAAKETLIKDLESCPKSKESRLILPVKCETCIANSGKGVRCRSIVTYAGGTFGCDRYGKLLG